MCLGMEVGASGQLSARPQGLPPFLPEAIYSLHPVPFLSRELLSSIPGAIQLGLGLEDWCIEHEYFRAQRILQL